MQDPYNQQTDQDPNSPGNGVIPDQAGGEEQQDIFETLADTGERMPKTPADVDDHLSGSVIPVPSQDELDHLAQNSDQSDLSEQAIEHATGRDPVLEAGPLPAGQKQDEETEEDIIRADMVQPGD